MGEKKIASKYYVKMITSIMLILILSLLFKTFVLNQEVVDVIEQELQDTAKDVEIKGVDVVASSAVNDHLASSFKFQFSKKSYSNITDDRKYILLNQSMNHPDNAKFFCAVISLFQKKNNHLKKIVYDKGNSLLAEYFEDILTYFKDGDFVDFPVDSFYFFLNYRSDINPLEAFRLRFPNNKSAIQDRHYSNVMIKISESLNMLLNFSTNLVSVKNILIKLETLHAKEILNETLKEILHVFECAIRSCSKEFLFVSKSYYVSRSSKLLWMNLLGDDTFLLNDFEMIKFYFSLGLDISCFVDSVVVKDLFFKYLPLLNEYGLQNQYISDNVMLNAVLYFKKDIILFLEQNNIALKPKYLYNTDTPELYDFLRRKEKWKEYFKTDSPLRNTFEKGLLNCFKLLFDHNLFLTLVKDNLFQINLYEVKKLKLVHLEILDFLILEKKVKLDNDFYLRMVLAAINSKNIIIFKKIINRILELFIEFDEESVAIIEERLFLENNYDISSNNNRNDSVSSISNHTDSIYDLMSFWISLFSIKSIGMNVIMDNCFKRNDLELFSILFENGFYIKDGFHNSLDEKSVKFLTKNGYSKGGKGFYSFEYKKDLIEEEKEEKEEGSAERQVNEKQDLIQNAKSGLLSLPTEILFIVESFLNLKDNSVLKNTCKNLYSSYDVSLSYNFWNMKGKINEEDFSIFMNFFIYRNSLFLKWINSISAYERNLFITWAIDNKKFAILIRNNSALLKKNNLHFVFKEKRLIEEGEEVIQEHHLISQ